MSKKVLTNTEIRVLEKGLDFEPIQYKINEPELRTDFEESVRECVLKGIFGTNLPQHLLKFRRLSQSLPGNFLEAILILKYF